MSSEAWKGQTENTPSARRERDRETGMTLVEIMVVVMIIGLIMGTVGVVAYGRWQKAQVETAKTVLSNIGDGVEMYMMDNNGDCPQDLDALRAHKIINKDPKDPWGKALIFKCPGEHNPDGFDISSSGPDKQEGTEDDLKNW